MWLLHASYDLSIHCSFKPIERASTFYFFCLVTEQQHNHFMDTIQVYESIKRVLDTPQFRIIGADFVGAGVLTTCHC